MEPVQRKLTLVTSLGKKYSGLIDLPSNAFRTTDLFNSSHVYWKDPNMKCYNDAILMSDIKLFIGSNVVYKKFDTLQIKLSEIIYLYDDIEQIGDEIEKKRASVLKTQTDDNAQTINIITRQVTNSFYDITGLFFGLFKQKSRDAFIPLTQTSIIEVFRKEGKWFQKKVTLPHHFICLSSSYIESVALS